MCLPAPHPTCLLQDKTASWLTDIRIAANIPKLTKRTTKSTLTVSVLGKLLGVEMAEWCYVILLMCGNGRKKQ